MNRRSFLATQALLGASLAALAPVQQLLFEFDSGARLTGLAFAQTRARPGETVLLSLEGSTTGLGELALALLGASAEVYSSKAYPLSADGTQAELRLPVVGGLPGGRSLFLRAAALGVDGLLLSAPLELVIDPFVFGL
jgi:hypothetical protein